MFYAKDSRIVGQYHKWLQDFLTAMVAMFRRMVINTNLEKTKYMVYDKYTVVLQLLRAS